MWSRRWRIIQEALTNARKHAHASSAAVHLRFAGGRLEAVIEDDGVGFDPAVAAQGPSVEGGVGLSSMHERAASVGGTLHIESAPGEGTRVIFSAPTPQAVGQAGRYANVELSTPA